MEFVRKCALSALIATLVACSDADSSGFHGTSELGAAAACVCADRSAGWLPPRDAVASGLRPTVRSSQLGGSGALLRTVEICETIYMFKTVPYEAPQEYRDGHEFLPRNLAVSMIDHETIGWKITPDATAASYEGLGKGILFEFINGSFDVVLQRLDLDELEVQETAALDLVFGIRDRKTALNTNLVREYRTNRLRPVDYGYSDPKCMPNSTIWDRLAERGGRAHEEVIRGLKALDALSVEQLAARFRYADLGQPESEDSNPTRDATEVKRKVAVFRAADWAWRIPESDFWNAGFKFECR